MPSKAKRGRRKLQVLTPTEVQMLLGYCEREEPKLTHTPACAFGAAFDLSVKPRT